MGNPHLACLFTVSSVPAMDKVRPCIAMEQCTKHGVLCMLNYHVYTEVEYLWHFYVVLLVFQKSCLFKMTVQLFKAFILNSLSKVLRLEGQDETVTQQLR